MPAYSRLWLLPLRISCEFGHKVSGPPDRISFTWCLQWGVIAVCHDMTDWDEVGEGYYTNNGNFVRLASYFLLAFRRLQGTAPWLLGATASHVLSKL